MSSINPDTAGCTTVFRRSSSSPSGCNPFAFLSIFVAEADGMDWSTSTAWSVFIAFTAVAIWSSIPLTMRVFVTFKSYRGLYFWSILATTWGLTTWAVAQILHYLVAGTPWLVVQLMAQAGWIAMVTGFSLTIYSRLNLIFSCPRQRWILYLILFNTFFFEIFMATLAIGMAASTAEQNVAAKKRWLDVFHVMERITILSLFFQEFLISAIYIRAAYQYLSEHFPGTAEDAKKTMRRIMIVLVLVQVVVVALDIGIIYLDFKGYNTLKLFLNSWVYACKLELEFIVLNQLVEMSRLGIPRIEEVASAIRHNIALPPHAPSIFPALPPKSEIV